MLYFFDKLDITNHAKLWQSQRSQAGPHPDVGVDSALLLYWCVHFRVSVPSTKVKPHGLGATKADLTAPLFSYSFDNRWWGGVGITLRETSTAGIARTEMTRFKGHR
jgi:hypothetical protein